MTMEYAIENGLSSGPAEDGGFTVRNRTAWVCGLWLLSSFLTLGLVKRLYAEPQWCAGVRRSKRMDGQGLLIHT